MPLISLETRINAPVEKVFDMARNVQVHCQSAAWTNERVVEEVQPVKKKKKAKPSAGKKKAEEEEPERPPIRPRTPAMLEKGDTVTFEANHLGKKRKLTSRVTNYDPPFSFTDKMLKGSFKAFSHQHNFQGMPDGTTVMYDIVEYSPPGGPLAGLIDKLVLEKYLREFLTRRNRNFKQIVEKAHADTVPAGAKNRTNPP